MSTDNSNDFERLLRLMLARCREHEPPLVLLAIAFTAKQADGLVQYELTASSGRKLDLLIQEAGHCVGALICEVTCDYLKSDSGRPAAWALNCWIRDCVPLDAAVEVIVNVYKENAAQYSCAAEYASHMDLITMLL